MVGIVFGIEVMFFLLDELFKFWVLLFFFVKLDKLCIGFSDDEEVSI